MNAVMIRKWAGLAVFAAALGASFASHGQASKSGEFTPQVGQAGKDVIWVPTPEELVERMLRMAQTTSSDFVYDLGSGDGRTVIAAAKKFGATAQGIEYNPDMVALSQKNAQAAGVAAKATFAKADLFETDLSKATVITMYLLPSINAKLKPKILALKPGTRVVSHAFDMEDWIPDEVSTVEGRRAMLWIVPAKVSGVWRMSIGDGGTPEMSITQRYQMLEGSIRFNRLQAGMRDAKMYGDRISFTFMDAAGNLHAMNARVTGDSMEGSMRPVSGPGQETRWTARR
jgi:hypothetical protein